MLPEAGFKKETVNIFLNIYLLPYMCMCVLPVCMSVRCVHAWCPERLEVGTKFPGTGVTSYKWL